MIKTGRYRHFKGEIYEVVGVAKHSETLEEMVVYRNEKGKLWARPKKMFMENVSEGVPRFKYIGK